MRLTTVVLTTLALLAVATPVLAGPERHGTSTECLNTFIVGNPGFALSGERCLSEPIGYWTGDHVTLDVKPFTGFDFKNATLEIHVHDAAYWEGFNPAATPVFSCLEGVDDGITHECPSHLDLVTLAHGKYVVVMTARVNETEIAPTVGAVTVPTGVSLSGGRYGFDLWYNHDCRLNNAAPGCVAQP